MAREGCLVADCVRRYFGHGLCQLHYQRNYRQVERVCGACGGRIVNGHCYTCARSRREKRKAATPEIRSYYGMIDRCHNPHSAHYSYYGGRGIAVHKDWRGKNGFARFLAHIGPRPSSKHSVDRIDNNKSYEPGNVRWATPKEQARNRRMPQRRMK